MQTLWWLPNQILRHIHKKRFSVFFSRFLRICNQSSQKVLMRAKFFYFIEKFKMSIKKRRISSWFRIRWKSFEKMHQKKLCTFFAFTHVRQTFQYFFTNFSTDTKSAWNSAFFNIFFDKKKFGVILALFGNFEAKCAKNGKKKLKNLFSKCVLDFNFAPIKGSVFFI